MTRKTIKQATTTKKGENSWMAYQTIPFQRSQILVSQDITSANSNGILTLFCGKNLR